MRVKRTAKFLVFCLILSLLGVATASAAGKNLTVTAVKSLKNAKGLKKNVISFKQDTLQQISSFKIAKAGAVKITVGNEGMGDATSICAEVFTDKACQSSVDPIGIPHISQGKEAAAAVYLEKGTYYLKICRNEHNQDNFKAGKANVSIAYVKSASTEKYTNSTAENPEPISIGKSQKGYFTYMDREDFYTFTLTKKTKINITAAASKTNTNNKSWQSYTVSLLDKKANEIQSVKGCKSKTNISLKSTLQAGTYIIKFSADNESVAGSNLIKVAAYK